MISQILDRLYVGDSTFLEEDLERFKITHIINVGGAKIPFGKVLHRHLRDDGTNNPTDISTILDEIKHVMTFNYGHRLLVCCRAGMSRSVYIIILWLQKMGMSKNEAYAFIKERHIIAQVNLDLLRSV